MYAAEIKTPLFIHTNHPPVEATMLQDSCDCFTSSKASLHANQQSKPQSCSSLNIPPQTQCSTMSFSTRDTNNLHSLNASLTHCAHTQISLLSCSYDKEYIYSSPPLMS